MPAPPPPPPRRSVVRDRLRLRAGRRGTFARAVLAALVVSALLAASPACVPPKAPPAPPHGFLARRGATLVLDGAPYATAGVNAYGMTGCGSADHAPYSASEMDALFGELPPRALTRAWAFRPQGLEALDRLVAAAEARDQLLVLSLGNDWRDCDEPDGIPAGKTARGRAWFEGGYRTSYLPWVEAVVRRFAASRAVGMWEILNEPGAGDGDGAGTPPAVLRAFVDDVAARIKALDPNHLVESGAESPAIAATADYALVHGGPHVDVGSFHDYDHDRAGAGPRPAVPADFLRALAGMRAVGKPILVGEIGVKANVGTKACLDREARSGILAAKFRGYLDAGAGAVLAWNWFPGAKNDCAYETIYPGDPAMDAVRGAAIRPGPPPR